MSEKVLAPQNQNQLKTFRAERRSAARKKRAQAVLTGGAAGAALTAAGLVGAGKLRKMPRLTDAGYVVGTGSGAAGAVSGFNFTRNLLSDAKQDIKESKKRYKVAPVAKRAGEPSVSEAAWNMSGNARDKRWRSFVSSGASHAYDEPLSASRRKAGRWSGAGRLANSAGLSSLGDMAKQRADDRELRARKIRARGFQRMIDAEGM